MTVTELKEYILQHMTAEQALERLLEGSLYEYEKLKFSEGKAMHPIMIATFVAMDLGWQISVENANGSDPVRGLTIGTADYMKEVFKE